MNKYVLDRFANRLGVDPEELGDEENLVSLHQVKVAGLLGVTAAYLERLQASGRILEDLMPTPGANAYDARELIDYLGRLCSRAACGRAFLTLDRRKLYCSPRCARHVSATVAVQKRRRREAAAKLRRTRAAIKALRLLKERPKRWKQWVAAQAGVSVNWVTRHGGAKPASGIVPPTVPTYRLS